MRNYTLCLAFTMYCFLCFAQKPPIDSGTSRKWTSVSIPQISNNGYYALYTIENQPVSKRTLIVVDTKNKWKLEVPGCTSYGFTSDSKHAIFIKEKDSLGIIRTGNDMVHYIPFVQSFKLPRKENAKWLIYQLSSLQKTLVIYNLENGKERTFDFVKQYLISDDGITLLFLTEEKKNSVTQVLHWLDLASGNITTIWKGANAGNFVFDKGYKQMAFTVERSVHDSMEKTFWYYKAGSGQALELATNLSIENDSTLKLENIIKFSEDGSSLFVSLKQKDFPRLAPSLVDVWSYTDVKLQSLQLKELYPKTYKAIIQIQHSELMRLEGEDESLTLPPSLDYRTDDWGLVQSWPGSGSEAHWNAKSYNSVFLISTRSGIRKRIPGLNNPNAIISPTGKYVIYYDPSPKCYFSYEIESGITRNITNDLPVVWIGYMKDRPVSNTSPRGIAGWMKNDEDVLIYDENDIWQINMAGKKPPVNITNGYGKKHNIVFYLSMSNYYNKAFSNSEQLIINAFNLENKDNGYYSKTLSKTGDPELLSMGPYLYDIPKNPYIPDGSNFTPLKAKQADVYLVQRRKANEAPNIFSTIDFKKFTPLSDIHPEKKYNWLTAELVTWNALDGRPLQGILYKPENFDPKKKYPIILHIYERKSDGLHAFLKPDVLGGSININIPWYVSNGYLVFLPDIYYKIGETGQSAVNSVVSAAQYLSKLPYVNPKKMGIQGGSFGGFETNYLVTHSNIFAAACGVSSLSNLVSAYGSLNGDGASGQGVIEFSQVRIGATLWQRPDLYIKNSPVFAADQVTTPLLIMHTTNDGACPFDNAVEFFTALRRLGKKAWMLQYAEGNHGVWGKSEIDFSIRMQQFFDHYLKDSAAPRWMMYGIPAAQNGFDNGYELVKEKDPKTGKWVTPKESILLTEEERKKVEALNKRKPITVTIN